MQSIKCVIALALAHLSVLLTVENVEYLYKRVSICNMSVKFVKSI